MENKSTNQVVTFGMKMNPVSRFLTDETRNQNNDTMSNSEVRKMSSDKIKKKLVNKILIICKIK